MRRITAALAVVAFVVAAVAAGAAERFYTYYGTTAAGGRITVTMRAKGLQSAMISADLVCTAPNSSKTTTMTDSSVMVGRAKFKSPGRIDLTYTFYYGPKTAPNATEVTRFVLKASGKRPRGGWKTLKGWFSSRYKSRESTTVCRSGKIGFTLT
jgi:hypothetical protein